MDKPHRGLVQVFTGEGKGKTTAALGTVLRAAGRGLRVYICYFMNTNYDSGEQEVLHRLPGVTWAAFGPGLVRHPEQASTELRQKARDTLAVSHAAMLSGDYDVIVLDEINIIVHWRWLEVAEAEAFIKDRPPSVELILTGRYADARIIALADLVTEMVKVKHPYDAGILARRGIEF